MKVSQECLKINNNDKMSLVDRLDYLENWTKHMAKGQMNFDVKLNSLAKELTGKVFNIPSSSILQYRLIYHKNLYFPLQGERSRVKRERDTKLDCKVQPIEIPD